MFSWRRYFKMYCYNSNCCSQSSFFGRQILFYGASGQTWLTMATCLTCSQTSLNILLKFTATYLQTSTFFQNHWYFPSSLSQTNMLTSNSGLPLPFLLSSSSSRKLVDLVYIYFIPAVSVDRPWLSRVNWSLQGQDWLSCEAKYKIKTGLMSANHWVVKCAESPFKKISVCTTCLKGRIIL